MQEDEKMKAILGLDPEDPNDDVSKLNSQQI